jgi:6-phosphofructokinase 1
VAKYEQEREKINGFTHSNTNGLRLLDSAGIQIPRANKSLENLRIKKMDAERKIQKIAVLTSGGDSQGMNAAVRAVVRAAIRQGLEVYAVLEGYRGLVKDGNEIRRMRWEDVGGIIHQGGTVIGSARSGEFRTREGRRRAAYNLVTRGIDGMVVIGGDGSLTGANVFRQEWPDLLAELVSEGRLDRDAANAHPFLAIVGLVGSIDNDMFGTDMTIGADTALHRIVEAVDAIASTAASHQRSFVVEVMGRHCGYLALMAGLATGANWVFLPENPPEGDWEKLVTKTIRAGRDMGRRHNIILVAEGAKDREGKPISSDRVREVLSQILGEDTRVTILGHVQRGGSPSGFDRNMSTILGYAAVQQLLTARPEFEPRLVGIRDNDITSSPLMENIEKTRRVAELITAGEYEGAMKLRGRSFEEAFEILRTILRAHPHEPDPGHNPLRLAVIHGGAPSPGMNTAVRAAVRLGIDRGHTMLGVRNGLAGLLKGRVREMDWMSVHAWVGRGGAELGTSRRLPELEDFYAVARRLEEYDVNGLLLIGGWDVYELAYRLQLRRAEYPAFRIPMVCLPATINNDLPGTEFTIGADTALNTIIAAVDRIKESAVAVRRCFIVEVMGRDCGYLALMGGMATGAEQSYLPEDGIELSAVLQDVKQLKNAFKAGKRLGLVISNENADPVYKTDFLVALFKKEGEDLFDVRRSILGHTQQGGIPSPFDRIQATRLAARAIDHLIQLAGAGSTDVVCIGRQSGKVTFTSIENLPSLKDRGHLRPKNQRWLDWRIIVKEMAGPALSSDHDSL